MNRSITGILPGLVGLGLLTLSTEAAAQDRVRGEGLSPDTRRNITCSSSGGYQRCSAPNTWRGARMVRQISEAACTFGVSWGYEREYIWVNRGCRGVFEAGDPVASMGERVTCSSGGRYVACPADTRRGVTLTRKLSDASCREGRSWGVEQGFIWVDRGCRAEFLIGGRGPERPGNPWWGHGREETVVCESPGNRIACPVRYSEHGVQLAKQLSKAACTQGHSWGYDRSAVWVDRGCRGVFRSGDASADPGERVTCASDGKMRSCVANTSRGVELVRQLSDRTCRLDYSWGWDRGYIWVDKGCRAEFRLGGTTTPER